MKLIKNINELKVGDIIVWKSIEKHRQSFWTDICKIIKVEIINESITFKILNSVSNMEIYVDFLDKYNQTYLVHDIFNLTDWELYLIESDVEYDVIIKEIIMTNMEQENK